VPSSLLFAELAARELYLVFDGNVPRWQPAQATARAAEAVCSRNVVCMKLRASDGAASGNANS